MDKVARLPAVERQALFSETAARLGMTPAVVEKDFWVTWTLDRLFQEPELARLLMFKGGTSLSKVYRLIERFSEDIDLVLDWRTVSGEDPMAKRSRAGQEKLNKDIHDKAAAYIGSVLLARVTTALGEMCHCEIKKDDTHVITVRYPGAFSDAYLRPDVQLEIGPLASWLPHEERTVSCYAAEAFPNVFVRRECPVTVIKAERTFWEKATILHYEAHRPDGNPQPSRYSRHYYDLARMAESPVKEAALADQTLLADVVAFKQRFYSRTWARYDLARPGTFRLVPTGAVLAAVKTDYRAMANMIFGHAPSFEDLLSILQALEDEINRF